MTAEELKTLFVSLSFSPRCTCDGQRVGGLQRQVSPHSRAGGGSALQGVDLSHPEEAVAGEGGGGQEAQDEGVPGLHALRHPGYAEPLQRPQTPVGAVLCAAVGRLLKWRTRRGLMSRCRL